MRGTRYKELPSVEKMDYLRSLQEMRRAGIQAQCSLDPMKEEFQLIGLFITVIDMHQQHYSGEFNYLHARGRGDVELLK